MISELGVPISWISPSAGKVADVGIMGHNVCGACEVENRNNDLIQQKLVETFPAPSPSFNVSTHYVKHVKKAESDPNSEL